MKCFETTLCLFALLVVPALRAQTLSPAEMSNLPIQNQSQSAPKLDDSEEKKSKVILIDPGGPRPFSRLAFSGGVSLMGANMQMATNLNRYLNLRGIGNLMNYSIDNISTNGFDIGGKLEFATAGVSVDYYPFPNHGLRLSPGVLFYNENRISATGTVPGGNTISLNDKDYYSARANSATGATPIAVTAGMNLNTNKQAFTMTAGWGNMISRSGGHWSFPVEIGAAFVGTPKITMDLTGWACEDSAQTRCADLMGTASLAKEVRTNLDAQITKWHNDIDVLKFYPIFSFGVSYNFRIR